MTIKENEKKVEVRNKNMIALKEFHVFQPNIIDLKIKVGDDLSEVPELYIQNLITEGVLPNNSKKGN